MLSKFFINRPIFASVISIVIILLGVISLPLLPVEKTPDITPPTVSVSASYPGANAEVVAETVATPLEEVINGVDGMIYMSSSSSDNGQMSISVTFEVGTDVDMATVLVQNRVAMAESKLPEEVRKNGVTTEKRSTNISMIVSLISNDGKYDDVYISNYINLRMKDVISRVPGVGSVNVFGAKDYSIRLWLNPELLKARGLTTDDVITAVKEQNIQVAAGQIGSTPSEQGQDFQYTIKTLGRLSDVEEFRNITLKAESDGKVLRLGDVAKIELGAADYSGYVNYNGQPSIAMGIYQMPGSNALKVANGIEETVRELAKSFPPGLEYKMPYDPTKFIRASIKEVATTLLLTTILVVLSVYIFLQDWRATLVPAVTIPVSLIGTLAVLMAFGMSINTLTLFGLVLVIGIVVDDAIVVVENTIRIIDEEGLSSKDAAIKAMGQITAPVITTTLVLLSVFVPTALMGGITGKLYQQFAVTIAVATVFSTLTALTLSPALCAILLKNSHTRHGNIFAPFNRMLKNTTNKYVGAVQILTRKTVFVMIAFAVICVLGITGFKTLPTGFIPDEDEGFVIVALQLPEGATLERTEKAMRKVEKIILSTPGVQEQVTIGGMNLLGHSRVSNAAGSFIRLKPWNERKDPQLHASKIVERLQGQFMGITDGMVMAFMPPPIQGLGMAGGIDLQVQDRGGAGLRQLESMGKQLQFAAMTNEKVMIRDSSLKASVPQLYVDVDRIKAKTLGVPLNSIFGTLQTYLGSMYINDFNLFGRTFKVIAQADSSFRGSAEDIGRLEVRNANGQMLPLSTVTTLRDTVGPQVVTHYNLYPSTSISGMAKPGYSSGQAIAEMEKVLAETLPSSMGYEWSGMSYQEIQAGTKTGMIFLLASVFAFLFLAAQYESWSTPLAIIMTIPLAVLGAIGFTWIRMYDNNIYTQIGMVLLIGLASKTAILLVEFAKSHHDEGHGTIESAIEAAKLRFRPILMTALSTALGALPLVLATGAGATSRRALGTAVFGGMIMATILGVLMIPVFYVVVQKSTDKAKQLEQKVEDKLLHHE